MRSDTVIFFALLTTLSLTAVNGFYDDTDEVIQLTYDNFADIFVSPHVWVVEFYAPWCSISKAFAPRYKEAARALKGIAKVGAIDCSVKGSDERSICGYYEVRGFPTVVMFGTDKYALPPHLLGNREAHVITDKALIVAQTIVSDRLAAGTETRSRSRSARYCKHTLEEDETPMVEDYSPFKAISGRSSAKLDD